MRTVIALVLLLAAGDAIACSCVNATLPDEVRQTAAIFTGKVVQLRVTGVVGGVSQIEATIDVVHAFKGSPGKTVVMQTSDGCCHCAFSFDIAETYVFFAYEENGALATSSCSRTKPVREAKEELQYLESLRR